MSFTSQANKSLTFFAIKLIYSFRCVVLMKLYQQSQAEKKPIHALLAQHQQQPPAHPPTHPFLLHPPGNSCQLAAVHLFLPSTMEGRKMFPSFPKPVGHFEAVRQPGWAKNFQAKFLALKCLGLLAVIKPQSICLRRYTISRDTALDFQRRAEKQKQDSLRSTGKSQYLLPVGLSHHACS